MGDDDGNGTCRHTVRNFEAFEKIDIFSKFIDDVIVGKSRQFFHVVKISVGDTLRHWRKFRITNK